VNVFYLLLHFICLLFKSKEEIVWENISLRSQLALHHRQVVDRKIPKPRATDAFRRLWVFLSQHFTGWKSCLLLFQPETVTKWHRLGFKYYWRIKSQGGRPKVSAQIISLIKRIHEDNPFLSPEKIHERLINMNIMDVPAPNTIAKYINHKKRKPPTERQTQSWLSFLHNHGIWAMDFATVPTLTFRVLYVLVIVSHDRRKIVHFAVTEFPNAQWMIQQIRNATPFGLQPPYLLHDNSSVFTDKFFQCFLSGLGIKSKRITPYCPWQNGICERLIGIIRRDLLNHIIPFNERHLTSLLKEYVDYYNNVRTHQSLDGETPIIPPTSPPITMFKDTVLHSKPILGGLYHSYEKHSPDSHAA